MDVWLLLADVLTLPRPACLPARQRSQSLPSSLLCPLTRTFAVFAVGPSLSVCLSVCASVDRFPSRFRVSPHPSNISLPVSIVRRRRPSVRHSVEHPGHFPLPPFLPSPVRLRLRPPTSLHPPTNRCDATRPTIYCSLYFLDQFVISAPTLFYIVNLPMRSR